MLIFESDIRQNRYSGLWACKLEGNSSVTFKPGKKAIITNATLDAKLDFNKRLRRSTFRFCRILESQKDGTVSESAATSICSFVPGRYENFSTSIPLSAGENYKFEVVGPNAIDIVGFFDDSRDGEVFDKPAREEVMEVDDYNEDSREGHKSGGSPAKRSKTEHAKSRDHSPSKKRQNEDHQKKPSSRKNHMYKGDKHQPKRARNDSFRPGSPKKKSVTVYQSNASQSNAS